MTDANKTSKTEVKRLSPQEYSKAKQMWASGRYNLAQISAELGVSAQALQRRFSRDDVRKGQDNEKHDKAIKESLENSIIADSQETARLISERKRVALLYPEQLEKRLMFVIAKATKDGLPLAAVHADIKAINDAIKGVDMVYNLASRVLGIERIEDQDKPLPVLRIQEMTADDIESVRQRQREAMDEACAPLIEGDLSQLDDGQEIEIEEIVTPDEIAPVSIPETLPEEDLS